MRLDRNLNKDGKGKYALIKLRAIPGNPSTPEELAAAILAHPECVDWGERHSDSEFFVLRLKDKYAAPALLAYSNGAQSISGRPRINGSTSGSSANSPRQ